MSRCRRGPLRRMLKRVPVVIAALLTASACRRPTAGALPPPASLRGANVLLVTIDTLRQDRVGAYGNRDHLTPTLDRLAAAGVRYAHAYTTAPLTLPAHASILTGLTPAKHGIHNNTRFRLDEHVPTLASRARASGYRTGAFVGAFVLDGRFGLNRGFDEYDDRLPHGDRTSFHYAERRAADVVRLAGDWILNPQARSSGNPQPLALSPQPWLCWVHLFDPHAPYDAPPEYRAGRAPYDAEVAYADAMLGTLLQRLNAAHALDRTLVVVTADHGESLGEHGETTHGLFAYEATLAVPLIVSAPQLTAGIVDSPASHVDVMPTILDLLGITVEGSVDGQSLARTPSADRAVRFEALDASLTRGWAPLRGVVQAGWKYIDLPEPELYDLNADPHELRNLDVGSESRAAALRALVERPGDAAGAAPRVALDADAASRLRALGYTAGGRPARPPTAADDPKRLVALNEQFNGALTDFDEGRADASLATLLDILRQRPDFVAARTSAAAVLIAKGDAAAAVRLIDEGLSRGEASPDLLARLGRARQAAGDLRGAAEALERARAAGDANPEATADLAVVYAALGRTDAARTLFRTLLEADPGSATTWYNLGLVELQAKRPPEAADAFRRATSIEPEYGDAWQGLGASLVATDRRSATEAWRHAERLRPRDYDLLFNLGMLLAGSDAPGAALPYLERFLREAPRPQYAGDVATVEATVRRIQSTARFKQ